LLGSVKNRELKSYEQGVVIFGDRGREKCAIEGLRAQEEKEVILPKSVERFLLDTK